MRLPFQSRLSRLSHRLRELARNRPEEAEEFLDTHQDEWEEIAETDPRAAADIREALHEEDAADLLRDLDADDAADVLDEMRAPAAADVIEEMSSEAAAELIAEMEPDQAVDLLAALEEDELRDEVIAALDPAVRLVINRLIVYPPDSAGGLMTTDYAALQTGVTTGEAIEALRRLHEEIGSNLTYVYVTDVQGKLSGVVPFRELVFARPHTGLDEIMLAEPVAVTVDTDREIVAFAAPRLPVDRPRYLMGVGYERDILAAVRAGVDMFDCVLPTRNGRNANAFTRTGPVRLRNACFRDDATVLDPGCDCAACSAGHSRAYLRHLFLAGEMLGPILVSLHNLRHYQRLMLDIQRAIREDSWLALCQSWPILGDELTPCSTSTYRRRS